jgi:hypothetical protein
VEADRTAGFLLMRTSGFHGGASSFQGGGDKSQDGQLNIHSFLRKRRNFKLKISSMSQTKLSKLRLFFETKLETKNFFFDPNGTFRTKLLCETRINGVLPGRRNQDLKLNFFLARTIGELHGLSDGSITPSASILSTSMMPSSLHERVLWSVSLLHGFQMRKPDFVLGQWC